jgi:hypothetical protein
MNEYRCPHGRIHINGGDLLSYHERLDEWGNKPGYRLFIDGTVQCSDCTAVDADKLAAGIQLRNELHEADRSFRRLTTMTYHHGDRVILPCGRTGTVSRAGRRSVYVDADTGADWSGPPRELRPAIPSEVGQPRVEQLRLF